MQRCTKESWERAYKIETSKRIAILVPIFNGGDFIRANLVSLLSQTHDNFVIIVCDDGSRDDSVEIVKQLQSTSKDKILLLQNTKNQGITETLIKLIALAKSCADIAIMIGQDDLLPREYVAKISRHFNTESPLVVTTRAICINQSGNRIQREQTPPYIGILGKYKTAALLASNQLNAPGAAFTLATVRPEFLGEENSLTQDWRLWLFLSTHSTFKVCKCTNVFYRRHSASLTSNPNQLIAHIEISKSRHDFILSSTFENFVSTLTLFQKRMFLLITLLFSQEFSKCRHNVDTYRLLKKQVLGTQVQSVQTKFVESCSTVKSQITTPKESKRPLTPSNNWLNCYKICLTTLKYFVGRTLRISLSPVATLWRNLNSISIFTAGGLGAQLSGLSYALWLRKYQHKPIKITFREKGLSFYPIIIEDLLFDFDYKILKQIDNSDAPKAIQLVISQNRIPVPLKKCVQLVRSVVKKCIDRFGVRLEQQHLSRQKMQRVNKLTRWIHGYHTDWSIIDEVWPELSSLISRHRILNFMCNAGLEESIAIHWRLGDYLTNSSANHTHGTVSLEAILDCLEKVIGESKIEKIKIFTDSPEDVIEKLAELHPSQKFEIISGNIWEDLYQMSRSRVFIGSHSSISGWAAMAIARSGLNSIVYLPTEWFKNPPVGFEYLDLSFLKPQAVITSIRSYNGLLQ